MILFQLLWPVAILYLIMHTVIGMHSMPDFWPFVVSMFVLNIIGIILKYHIGDYAILPNLIILIGGIALIHRLEFKKVAISAGIYAALLICFRIISSML